MRGWIAAAAVFFVYVAAIAPIVPRLAARRRWLAAAGALSGLGLAAAAQLQPHQHVLHDWLIPPALLFVAYWSSGLLYSGPSARAEAALASIDRALAIDRLAAATPRWLAEVLESAYVGVYPLVPLALAIHLRTAAIPDAERFWTVVLVIDFLCFGVLPWVPTRPPRAFRLAPPWPSVVRSLNLELLGRASIRVNTFPSGHAAEALAAALLVAPAPWPIAAAGAISALLVSAGAVLGRYHYAADALTGWAVALIVWAMVW